MWFSQFAVALLIDKNMWKYYRNFLVLVAYVVNIRPYRLKKLIELCCNAWLHEQIRSIFRKHWYIIEDRGCKNACGFIYDPWIRAEICCIGLYNRKFDERPRGRWTERERGGRGSYSWRIAKHYFEFHSDGTRDSEINQIQSHNSDYRVRNLIYLHVIVVPFILRYGIPPDAVNGWRYRWYLAYWNELGRP